ncbi:MAG TPA: hypothetical protein PLU71_04330 [Candidatus Dependentiae bacterium]|nr:hypothetical protein [Candidatus Dependentiae bacterium]HRQ63060.1 hypothetical protein [Candidatus Dependentiae bacterium]
MKKLTLLLLLSFPTVYAMEDLPKNVQSNLPWTFEELQEKHSDFDLTSKVTKKKLISRLLRYNLSKEFWTNKRGTLLAYAILSEKYNKYLGYYKYISLDDTPEGIYIFRQLVLKTSVPIPIGISHEDLSVWYYNITSEMTQEDATDIYNEHIALVENKKKAELYYTQEFLSSESDNSDDDSNSGNE